MKKLNVCIALTLLFCLLTACGSDAASQFPETSVSGSTSISVPEIPASEPTSVSVPDSPPSLAVDEEPARTLCRIVDGAEDGNLLLAALDGGYGHTAQNK